MTFSSGLLKASWVDINTLSHRFTSDIVLNEASTNKIKSQVEKWVTPLISQVVSRLPAIIRSKVGSLSGSSVSSSLLVPALDEETKLFRMSIESSGSVSKPKVKLTKPSLGDPKKVINKALSKGTENLKDAALDMAKQKAEKAKEEAKKLAEQKKKDVEAKAKVELERKKAELERKKKEAEEKAKQEALKKARKKVKLPF